MKEQTVHFFTEENHSNQRVIRLTERQVEVLHLLCAGMPNKVISRRLGITSATVKVHVSSVLRALGVGTRLQAVVEAQARGLMERPGAADTFDTHAPAMPVGTANVAQVDSPYPHHGAVALG